VGRYPRGGGGAGRQVREEGEGSRGCEGVGSREGEMEVAVRGGRWNAPASSFPLSHSCPQYLNHSLCPLLSSSLHSLLPASHRYPSPLPPLVSAAECVVDGARTRTNTHAPPLMRTRLHQGACGGGGGQVLGQDAAERADESVVRRMLLGHCAARGRVHGCGAAMCGACVVLVAGAGPARPACVWCAVGHTHSAPRHSSKVRTPSSWPGGNACRWRCKHARKHARQHARTPLTRTRLHQGKRPAIRRTGRRRIRKAAR
jgi:hypothetical protein